MGYTTDFWGSFSFNKPVDEKLAEYINNFSQTRHMRRDNNRIKQSFPDWRERCFNGTLGVDGEYFLGSSDSFDDYSHLSVLDCNFPPSTQPGLWCQWIIDDSGELVWDEGEKFYNYVEWLKYLIENFFAPNGYILDGAVEFQGEDADDRGIITVSNNEVKVEYHVLLSNESDANLIAEMERRGYAVYKM